MEFRNKVELLGYYGSDLTHAQSAWTSTVRDLTEDKLGRVDKLLKFLAQEGHHTPFEKSTLHFLVTVDQATHIHLLKHRIGVSINGECLVGDTKITFINSSGSLKRVTMEELYNKWNNGRPHQNTEKDKEYSRNRVRKMTLRVLNEDTGVFEKGHVKDVMVSGIKKVYEVTTECGKKIRCSDNHRILTDEGWKTISTGLTTKDFIAVNGVTFAGNGLYKEKKELQRCRESGMSVSEMAKYFGCSYHTIRKWLKIHDLKFTKEERDFKRGHIPWNKGKKGYKLSYSEEGWNNKMKAAKRQPKGELSPLWRGGVTSERGLIGQWTRGVAREIHEKYNYTCQSCGKGNKDLHCHHIIPVVVDSSRAYDKNNLITVCKKCHQDIHKTAESELEFAKKVSSEDFTPLAKKFGKNNYNRRGNVLKVHYSKIVSIVECGEEMCYDLEVDHKFKNFVANGVVVHNSARYKELKEDKMYMPEDWLNYGEVGKDIYDSLIYHAELGNELYHGAIKELQDAGMDRKRAKESARFFKTFNSQIDMDISFNWRSFYHFQQLRNSEDAQLEVRELAQQMLELVKNIEGNPFKHTIEAFNL